MKSCLRLNVNTKLNLAIIFITFMPEPKTLDSLFGHLYSVRSIDDKGLLNPR